MPLILNGDTGISGVDGSAGTPSYQGTDTNTGIFYPAADTIALSTSGAERLRVDSSGNVSQTGGSYFLGNGGGFGWGTLTTYMGGTSASNFINFITSSSERMRIDSSGNVGIGTSSPSSPLSFAPTTGQKIRFFNSLSGYGIGVESSEFRFVTDNGATFTWGTGTYASPTERMRIASSGFVGIGTNSPNERLTVAGAIRATSNAADFAASDGALIDYNAGDMRIVAARNGANSSNMTFTTYSSGTPGERMRITSGGELLIGRTSTLNARLGILSSSGACSINCGDEADPSDYGMIQIVRNANQPDNKFHLAFIRGGNKIAGMGFLDNSDTLAIQNASSNAGAGVTLTNAATSWGTTSDERKKNIIAPVENALTKLADWRSVYYKYKNDEADAPQRVGLIAQDVQATLPEAVSVEEDEIKTLQLRYTETIPLLVKAIQEQQAMIEELKAKVAALEAK